MSRLITTARALICLCVAASAVDPYQCTTTSQPMQVRSQSTIHPTALSLNRTYQPWVDRSVNNAIIHCHAAIPSVMLPVVDSSFRVCELELFIYESDLCSPVRSHPPADDASQVIGGAGGYAVKTFDVTTGSYSQVYPVPTGSALGSNYQDGLGGCALNPVDSKMYGIFATSSPDR